MTGERSFTPALGHAALTPLYDSAIALMTREQRWRERLLQQISPHARDVIVDVGCGTGTLALMIKRATPAATVIGLDPDPEVLSRARLRAQRAGLAIEFEQGFARDVARFANRGVTKVVSSLVFHQVPMDEKRAALGAMRTMLQTHGEAHIADYGLQRTALMRALFAQVQMLDGKENTTPNAQGVLTQLMTEAGFANVVETAVIATPTGSISLYRAVRPNDQGTRS
ncbi:class I SAM-dependent methyltransferase [Vitreimonas sp.]|uniref:class I SAM-dependent methyltransferase n=1 Tax=Vitreimonas sp. TaxID=3069702 RepID=UPI002EDB8F0B